MKLTYFLLLVLTFPYWLPVAVAFCIGIGALWMIGYPIACTVHMLYVRARYGKWVHWQLLYPGHDCAEIAITDEGRKALPTDTGSLT